MDNLVEVAVKREVLESVRLQWNTSGKVDLDGRASSGQEFDMSEDIFQDLIHFYINLKTVVNVCAGL